MCRYCHDEGWVELKGTVKAHGVEYSRGMAPCKWCEQGRRRLARMVELKQYPETRFTERDVVMPTPYESPARADVQTLIKSLGGAMPRVPSAGETIEYERKKRAAAAALKEGSGTVELPAEPAPDPFNPPYDPDEIPF